MILKAVIFGILVVSQTVFAQTEEAPELPPLETIPVEPEAPVLEAPPADLQPLEPVPSEPVPAPAPEEFRDPFANPSPEAAPAEPSLQPPPPLDEPQLPTFKESDSFSPPAAPDGSQPLEVPSDRAKPFEFPKLENEKNAGPTSQVVVDRANQRQTTAVGTWGLTGVFGGALNMNRSENQVSLEVSGSYRLDLNWDIALTTYMRFFKVKYLGLLVQSMYYFRLTDPESFRWELGVGGGLGWTLRAAKSSFNESRFPVRAQLDSVFYAGPRFAVVLSTAVESFVYGISKSKGVNLMKDGGPPTQLLGNLGVRFEF